MGFQKKNKVAVLIKFYLQRWWAVNFLFIFILFVLEFVCLLIITSEDVPVFGQAIAINNGIVSANLVKLLFEMYFTIGLFIFTVVNIFFFYVFVIKEIRDSKIEIWMAGSLTRGQILKAKLYTILSLYTINYFPFCLFFVIYALFAIDHSFVMGYVIYNIFIFYFITMLVSLIFFYLILSMLNKKLYLTLSICLFSIYIMVGEILYFTQLNNIVNIIVTICFFTNWDINIYDWSWFNFDLQNLDKKYNIIFGTIKNKGLVNAYCSLSVIGVVLSIAIILFLVFKNWKQKDFSI